MYLLYCRPIFLSRQYAKSSTVTMASNLGKKSSSRRVVLSSRRAKHSSRYVAKLLRRAVFPSRRVVVSSRRLGFSSHCLLVLQAQPAWSVNSRCAFIHLRPLPETASAACPRFLSQLSLAGFAYPHVLFNCSLPSLLVFLSFFSQVEFSPLDWNPPTLVRLIRWTRGFK